MPTPGSHKYDLERTRLRKRLEDAGIPDKAADEQANRIMQQAPAGDHPAAHTERAGGPYGEHGGGGDPAG